MSCVGLFHLLFGRHCDIEVAFIAPGVQDFSLEREIVGCWNRSRDLSTNLSRFHMRLCL